MLDYSPMNPNGQQQRNVFTFDTPPLGAGFDLPPSSQYAGNYGHFSQDGNRVPYSPAKPSFLSFEQPSPPVDPFYMPNFRNQSLSEAYRQHDDRYSSPLLNRTLLSDIQSARPSRSRVLSLLSLACRNGLSLHPDTLSYYGDDLLTPTRQSRFNALSASPSFARSPALSDTLPYESRALTPPTTPPTKHAAHAGHAPHSARSDAQTHTSPPRPKRSMRSRGGSPGSPDPVNELKIADVRSGKDTRTTLMIKNIPNA